MFYFYSVSFKWILEVFMMGFLVSQTRVHMLPGCGPCGVTGRCGLMSSICIYIYKYFFFKSQYRSRTSLVAQWWGFHLPVQEMWVPSLVGKLSWRRKWQPTPVFLPGKFHGQRSLAATVHGVAESQTRLSNCQRHQFICAPTLIIPPVTLGDSPFSSVQPVS